MTKVGEFYPVLGTGLSDEGGLEPAQTLLDVRELAEFLQVSERLVRDLVRAREIPYFKVGRLLRFDKEKVLDHLLVEPIPSVELPCQKAPKKTAQRVSRGEPYERYDRGSRNPWKHYDEFGNLIEDGEE